MKGKVCIVTGATSGIGKEAARQLVGMGARVVIVGRNEEKTARVAAELGVTETHLADVASLDAVRTLAIQIRERHPRVDVLLSNAGVYRLRRRETMDGYEETFAVNHLAPFLLINLLRDHLAATQPARIVLTASDAHQGARLDFDDLMLRKHYGQWRAYSRSKLANVMFTYALARRLQGTGVTVNAHHPGFVASNLGSGNGIPVKPFMTMLRPFVLSPAEGARTAVYLASSPDVASASGLYFTNSKIAARANREHRSNAFSYDADAQERLWKESENLVGLT